MTDCSQAIDLPLICRGKVRSLYRVSDSKWLMVASNHLSAYDVVLPGEWPGKGAVLTQLSRFWFDRTQNIITNHCLKQPLADLLPALRHDEELQARCLLIKPLKPLPIEAVVRGYLVGSGWRDYQQTGEVCGIPLPRGMQLAQALPEPIFTPATKAPLGEHDENIGFGHMVQQIGDELSEQIRQVSLKLYQYAADYAAQRGLIIADTKFEFGLDEDNRLVLMDEILTPDSSRLWVKDHYRVGQSPYSLDKQYVRDYLQSLDWDKSPPGPVIPESIRRELVARYQLAHQRLTAEVTHG